MEPAFLPTFSEVSFGEWMVIILPFIPMAPVDIVSSFLLPGRLTSVSGCTLSVSSAVVSFLWFTLFFGADTVTPFFATSTAWDKLLQMSAGAGPSLAFYRLSMVPVASGYTDSLLRTVASPGFVFTSWGSGKGVPCDWSATISSQGCAIVVMPASAIMLLTVL